jgi:hypothetical protein
MDEQPTLLPEWPRRLQHRMVDPFAGVDLPDARYTIFTDMTPIVS